MHRRAALAGRPLQASTCLVPALLERPGQGRPGGVRVGGRRGGRVPVAGGRRPVRAGGDDDVVAQPAAVVRVLHDRGGQRGRWVRGCRGGGGGVLVARAVAVECGPVVGLDTPLQPQPQPTNPPTHQPNPNPNPQTFNPNQSGSS